MPAPFAEPEDVAGRLNVIYTSEESVQVALLLRDVSALIRARRPSIDTWTGSGEVNEDLVKAVACQVAIRVIGKVGMGGIALKSETYPEYAYQLTDGAAAGLSLTDAELLLLTPPSTERHRAFSIIPG